MSKLYTVDVTDVFDVLQTDKEGLSKEEAAKRQKIFGENKLEQKNKASVFGLFLSQFKDFMVIMLVAAAFVSGVMAYVSKDSHELFDTIIIVLIIFINATVGFFQQYKADKAIEKLKQMSVNTTKVYRDKKVVDIDSSCLVPGDVIVLEEGDYVPADCRIVKSFNLVCDESSLTGESVPVSKSEKFVCAENTPLGDIKNMVFASSYVVGGKCEAVVADIGMKTQIGKIADMLDGGDEEQTPLQKNLNRLGKFLSYLVIGVATLIFAFGAFFKHTPIVQNFMSSVAIAVAAIPEGLPAVVTIIMAMGMQKMSKSKVIVRKLHAVETLGSCNFICSDKTGTLTQNKMQVTDTWMYDESVWLANCMQYCSSVKEVDGLFSGDPTEVAIKNYLHNNKIKFDDGVVTDEIPFDSDRKLMTVCVDKTFSYTKGAPDVLLGKCTHFLYKGEIKQLTDLQKREIMAYNSKMASKALRVIGFAFKKSTIADEEGLVFLGLCGMIDPPRKEAMNAVEQCKKAGITVVMITGDHKNTAFAVARQLGIADDERQVVDGASLDKADRKTLKKLVGEARVYARVSPKHKSIIVKELQEKGNVVAMTGDGINDAPSIKSADIGIAMGISGTDVTKNASDMIIADDDFSTIVLAVKEGRRIFSNIKKTIYFFLATNLAEVLSIFIVSVLFARIDFLLSSQLLWINLVTDSFPVLALGTERAEKDIMSKKPQKKSNVIFDNESIKSICFFGLVITSLALITFFGGSRFYGEQVGRTMTFFVLSFAELFHSLNVRSELLSIGTVGFFSNKALIFTIAGAVVVNVLICVVPVLKTALCIVSLDLVQWIAVFALSFLIVPVGEIYKFFKRNKIEKRGV